MKIKNTILVGLLAACFPVAVQAQNVENHEEYQVSCQASEECSDLNGLTVNYQQQSETEKQLAQRTRTLPRRTRRGGSDFKKLYLGGTLGVFSPEELDDGLNIDPGTGVGGSLHVGYKFSKFLGGDIELLIFGGEAEVPGTDFFDDSVYASVGLFANPRFTYSFNQDNVNKSLYVFLSPGVGINAVAFGGDIEDDLDDSDTDTSGAGLALQAKAGVGLPLSETLDVFGQARYLKTFNIYTESDDDLLDDQDFDSLGFELGLNLKF